MKTKQELEQEFTVENEIIQNPGKFEGEPLTTPFYYYISLEEGDTLIDIDKDDFNHFDNIPLNYEYALVMEDTQGFVSIEWIKDLDHYELLEEENGL